MFVTCEFSDDGQPIWNSGRRPVFTGDLRRGPTFILPNDEASCLQNPLAFRGSSLPLNPVLLLCFLMFLIRIVERQIL